MNNANIIGRLTKDIEIRSTTTGRLVTSFCVAVPKDKEHTYFIDCVAWDAVAQNLQKYFHKGDKLGISGLITTRTYEKDGTTHKLTEIIVNSFDFCNDTSKQAQPKPQQATVQPQQAQAEPQEPVTGELPFEI